MPPQNPTPAPVLPTEGLQSLVQDFLAQKSPGNLQQNPNAAAELIRQATAKGYSPQAMLQRMYEQAGEQPDAQKIAGAFQHYGIPEQFHTAPLVAVQGTQQLQQQVQGAFRGDGSAPVGVEFHQVDGQQIPVPRVPDPSAYDPSGRLLPGQNPTVSLGAQGQQKMREELLTRAEQGYVPPSDFSNDRYHQSPTTPEQIEQNLLTSERAAAGMPFRVKNASDEEISQMHTELRKHDAAKADFERANNPNYNIGMASSFSSAALDRIFRGLIAPAEFAGMISNAINPNSVNATIGWGSPSMNADIEKAVQKVFPTNPDHPLLNAVGSGTGDIMMAFLFGNLGKPVSTLGASATGRALQSAQSAAPALIQTALPPAISEYKNAVEAGASTEKAWGTFLWNLGIGASDMAPILKYTSIAKSIAGKDIVGDWLRQNVASGALRRSLAVGAGAATQGLAEGAQEVLQGAFTNLTAQHFYDTNRKMFDPSLQLDGSAGAIIGALMDLAIKGRQRALSAGNLRDAALYQRSEDILQDAAHHNDAVPGETGYQRAERHATEELMTQNGGEQPTPEAVQQRIRETLNGAKTFPEGVPTVGEAPASPEAMGAAEAVLSPTSENAAQSGPVPTPETEASAPQPQAGAEQALPTEAAQQEQPAVDPHLAALENLHLLNEELDHYRETLKQAYPSLSNKQIESAVQSQGLSVPTDVAEIGKVDLVDLNERIHQATERLHAHMGERGPGQQPEAPNPSDATGIAPAEEPAAGLPVEPLQKMQPLPDAANAQPPSLPETVSAPSEAPITDSQPTENTPPPSTATPTEAEGPEPTEPEAMAQRFRAQAQRHLNQRYSAERQPAAPEYVRSVTKQLNRAYPNLHIVHDAEQMQAALKKAGYHGEMPHGAVAGGKVYLNPETVAADTPIHEVAHVHVKALEARNPALHKRLLGAAAQDAAHLKTKERYPSLSAQEQLEETVSEAIGKVGARMFTENDLKPAPRDSPLVRLAKQAIQWLSKTLGLRKPFAHATLEDMATAQAMELLSGRKLSDMSEKDIAKLVRGIQMQKAQHDVAYQAWREEIGQEHPDVVQAALDEMAKEYADALVYDATERMLAGKQELPTAMYFLEAVRKLDKAEMRGRMAEIAQKHVGADHAYDFAVREMGGVQKQAVLDLKKTHAQGAAAQNRALQDWKRHALNEVTAEHKSEMETLQDTYFKAAQKLESRKLEEQSDLRRIQQEGAAEWAQIKAESPATALAAQKRALDARQAKAQSTVKETTATAEARVRDAQEDIQAQEAVYRKQQREIEADYAQAKRKLREWATGTGQNLRAALAELAGKGKLEMAADFRQAWAGALAAEIKLASAKFSQSNSPQLTANEAQRLARLLLSAETPAQYAKASAYADKVMTDAKAREIFRQLDAKRNALAARYKALKGKDQNLRYAIGRLKAVKPATVDIESLPDGWTLEDYFKEWTAVADAVLKGDLRPGIVERLHVVWRVGLTEHARKQAQKEQRTAAQVLEDAQARKLVQDEWNARNGNPADMEMPTADPKLALEWWEKENIAEGVVELALEMNAATIAARQELSSQKAAGQAELRAAEEARTLEAQIDELWEEVGQDVLAMAQQGVNKGARRTFGAVAEAVKRKNILPVQTLRTLRRGLQTFLNTGSDLGAEATQAIWQANYGQGVIEDLTQTKLDNGNTWAQNVAAWVAAKNATNWGRMLLTSIGGAKGAKIDTKTKLKAYLYSLSAAQISRKIGNYIGHSYGPFWNKLIAPLDQAARPYANERDAQEAAFAKVLRAHEATHKPMETNSKVTLANGLFREVAFDPLRHADEAARRKEADADRENVALSLAATHTPQGQRKGGDTAPIHAEQGYAAELEKLYFGKGGLVERAEALQEKLWKEGKLPKDHRLVETDIQGELPPDASGAPRKYIARAHRDFFTEGEWATHRHIVEAYESTDNPDGSSVADRMAFTARNVHGQPFRRDRNYAPLAAKLDYGSEQDFEAQDRELFLGQRGPRQTPYGTMAGSARSTVRKGLTTYDLDAPTVFRRAMGAALFDVHVSQIAKATRALLNPANVSGGLVGHFPEGMEEHAKQAMADLSGYYLSQLKQVRDFSRGMGGWVEEIFNGVSNMQNLAVIGPEAAIKDVSDQVRVAAALGEEYVSANETALRFLRQSGASPYSQYVKTGSAARFVRSSPHYRKENNRYDAFAALVRKGALRVGKGEVNALRGAEEINRLLKQSTEGIAMRSQDWHQSILFYGAVEKWYKRNGVEKEHIPWNNLSDDAVANAVSEIHLNFAPDTEVGSPSFLNVAANLKGESRKGADRTVAQAKKKVLYGYRKFQINQAREFQYNLTQGISRIHTPQGRLMLGKAGAYLVAQTQWLLTRSALVALWAIAGDDEEEKDRAVAELTTPEGFRRAVLANVLAEAATGHLGVGYGMMQSMIETGNRYAVGDEYDPYTHSVVNAPSLAFWDMTEAENRKYRGRPVMALKDVLARQMLGSTYYTEQKLWKMVEQGLWYASHEDKDLPGAWWGLMSLFVLEGAGYKVPIELHKRVQKDVNQQWKQRNED